MRQLPSLAIGLVLLSVSAFGQSSPPADREAMYQRYLTFSSRIKGGKIDAHWLADGDRFWYAEGVPDRTVINVVDPNANTKTPLFDTARLRAALEPVLGHAPPYQGLPFQTFTFVDGEKAVKFAVADREFICRLDTYEIVKLPAPSPLEKARTTPQVVRRGSYGRPDVMELLSPDGRWFARVDDHNLSLRSTYDGRREPLTTDGVDGDEWELSGAKWAPDSLSFAVKKVDIRALHKVPVVHWLKTTEEVVWVPYTKAGGPMAQTALFVVDILSKRPVKIDTGEEPDQYINVMGWRADGSEVLIQRMNRELKRLDVMAADPKTGASRIILTETSKTFIRGLPYHSNWPDLFTPLDDDKRFIWASERDGWGHLYLYDFDGSLIRRLTSGAFQVIRVIGVDSKTGWVYFSAHDDTKRPYDIHLYRVTLEGKGFARLTEEPGQHEDLWYPVGAGDSRLSPSKKFFLDSHSSLDRPPRVDLRRADGTLVQTVSVANVDGLKELQWQPPEEFTAKAADGKTDLYGIVYKPYDFDPKKKYPVVDFIYGGPQTPEVPRVFDTYGVTGYKGVSERALAQLGFIVVNVDARGTPERGKAFQDVVYRNFGRNEIPDHVAAITQLAAARPYIDLTRVGVFGHSWGGYMTVRAMVLAPDFYRVGVSAAPVVDLYDHWGGPIEPYMGLPQNNKEGYDYGSSLPLAGNLRGHLLLVHGTLDINASFSSTMKMAEAFVRAGKPYDLLVLPDQPHSFSGVSRAYEIDAVRRYFQEHLRP